MAEHVSPAGDTLRIGPYRTVRELGRGGQAIVWLADDSRIGRQVALKVLPHLGPGAEGALTRFRREAEVAARLEHPAICGVLEADLDQGTPYIAMRYVAGETLARRIARARERGDAPPVGEALRELARFFETCARALHAAHEAGIVHRDVKPANVMVTPEGEPVILDFGLARGDEVGGHVLSVSGEVSGTPAYMSPEQMTGRARPDRRSDVWSLGIALYEAATLAHPFAAATREGLFQAVLAQDPEDPRRLNPAIDRDLATILETATAKERDRRYQTALDLAEDLRRWREREPIRARPAGRIERTLLWARRKPALAASVAAIALLAVAASALLAYGVGASGRADVEAHLRAAAESARSAADAERARAEAALAALEQVRADRELSDDLDELNMVMGTLQFGLQDEKSTAALAPRYLAAFRTYGADLEGDVAAATARLGALRARNLELWRAVHDGLRNLGSIVREAPGPAWRAHLVQILAAFEGPASPELAAAEARWRAGEPDAFAPLLTDAAIAARSADELYELAGSLLMAPDHLDDAHRVLKRALVREPSSFRLHFLVGALGFMRLFQAQSTRPADAPGVAAELLHHMQVAVALRPRSGFMRAMQANAHAMNQQYADAARCIDEAVELEPQNALVWFLRARFYGYTPMPERGVEACRRALELDPELSGARELLAELEERVRSQAPPPTVRDQQR